MNKDRSFIKKASAVFASNTLLSRLTGLFRDIILSSYFSARETDIWITAFRVPNLLRRLVAENAITVSVVPVLSDYLKNKDKESFNKLVNSIFTVFVGFLLILVILGIIFSPFIIKIMVPSFAQNHDKFLETVRLAKIMFPYIGLIAITALFMGILNTLNHFFATAFHPVLFNLIFAFGIMIVKGGSKGLVWAGVFVIFGGISQVVLEVIFLRKQKIKAKFIKNIDFSGVKKILKLLLPALVSSSVVPIAVLINTIFASSTGDGGVSYLYWSDRIVQLPLGVFAVALSTAVLPLFSKNKDNPKAIIESYEYAFKLTSAITIPFLIVIYLMATPIVELVFERGNFTSFDTVNTGFVLSILALSLVPSGIIRITTSLYYAFSRPIIPLVSSFISIALNLLFAWILVPKYGLKGLAMAIVIGTSFSAVLLLLFFRIKILPLKIGSVRFFLKLTILNIVLFFFIKYFYNYIGVGKLNTIIVLTVSAVFFIFTAYFIKLKKEL